MKRPGQKTLIAISCLTLICLAFVVRYSIYQKNPHWEGPNNLDKEPQIPKEIISVHYHHRRPFYIRDKDKVYGLVIDPIANVFKAAGIAYIWRETPAKRQLQIIAAGEDYSCGAGWFKTPERETFARYTLPIYRDKPFVAVLRSDDEYIHSQETTLDEVLKEWRLKLLVKEGYSYGPYIDQRLKVLAPRQISTTGENHDILKMIENYRADYSFMTEEEADDLLASQEINAERYKIVRFVDMPPGGERHLMCSKKVGDETIARLNAAIRRQYPERADQ